MHLGTAATITTALMSSLTQSYKINLDNIQANWSPHAPEQSTYDNAIWIDGELPCRYVNMGGRRDNIEPWDHADGRFMLNNVDHYRLVHNADNTLSILNADGSERSKGVVNKWYAKLSCHGIPYFVHQEVQFE